MIYAFSSSVAPFSVAGLSSGFSSGFVSFSSGFFSAEEGFSVFSSTEFFFSFLVNCKVSTSSSDRILEGLGAFFRSMSELGLIREKFAYGKTKENSIWTVKIFIEVHI